MICGINFDFNPVCLAIFTGHLYNICVRNEKNYYYMGEQK